MQNKGEIFFTKNGEHLGVAFRGVHGQLYPTVGLHSEGEEVRVNFGEEPFQVTTKYLALCFAGAGGLLC